MSSNLIAQLCRIAAPEKLPDRLLASGSIRLESGTSLTDAPVLGYVFEVSRPWMPNAQLLPALSETLETAAKAIDPKANLDDQFELILRQVNQTLNQISEAGESDWIGNLNGLILLLGRDELHFSQTGRCPAFLLQNNRIRQITDDQPHDTDLHPLKTFSNLASGQLLPGDQILISNQELYNEISLDALRRILNTATPFGSATAITRELKRQKNCRIASLIIAIRDTPPTAEPEMVSLEEALQSNLKKIQRKLTPIVHAARGRGTTLAKLTGAAAQRLGEATVKATVKVAGQAGEKAKVTMSALDQTIEKKLVEHREAPAAAVPVIEDILPGSAQLAPTVPVVAPSVPTEAANASDDEPTDAEIGSIIPITTEAPAKHVSRRRQGLELLQFFFLKKLPYLLMNGLHHSILWLQEPKNKKIAALGLAVVLVGLVVWGAIAQSRPKNTPAGQAQITTTLQEVTDLSSKIASDVASNQTVEASSLTQTAQTKLQSIVNPSDSQRQEINRLWNAIQTQADTLTSTSRLASTAAVYSFNKATPASFITNLPYFYATQDASKTLIRTGSGDLQKVQSSTSLPDASDSIVSIAKSSETDTSGYALSKQGKVYRIVQSGSDTLLRPISPATGDFAVGDSIASYSGNVYILDSKSGLIWRYLNSGTSYSKGTSLIDVNKYNIRDSISVSIDGSFYFLKQTGTVVKFSGGKQDESFSLKNQPVLSQKLVKPVQILAGENVSNIYILDAGMTNSDHSTAKIIEFSKNGEFERQYAFPDSFTNVKGFDVDEKGKKLWILNASTISEFNL